MPAFNDMENSQGKEDGLLSCPVTVIVWFPLWFLDGFLVLVYMYSETYILQSLYNAATSLRPPAPNSTNHCTPVQYAATYLQEAH